MHYKTATTGAHTFMKKAFEDVENLMASSTKIKIENPETLIAAFVQSATQLYIQEMQQKDKGQHLP